MQRITHGGMIALGLLLYFGYHMLNKENAFREWQREYGMQILVHYRKINIGDPVAAMAPAVGETYAIRTAECIVNHVSTSVTPVDAAVQRMTLGLSPIAHEKANKLITPRVVEECQKVGGIGAATKGIQDLFSVRK